VLVPLATIALAMSARRPDGALLAGVFAILAVVWLGFTHLQGRFLLLAVPLGAVAIGMVRWGIARVGVLIVLLLAAGRSAVSLHRELADRLYGPTPLVTDLGSADVGDLTATLREGLPPDAPLLLVGDAKAFWYPLPMSRLRYRTVFDADTSHGRGIKEAWGVGRGPPGEWVVVDPMELERFAQTYQPFPPPPPEWTARPEWKAGRPFLLPPAEAGP
jgi:hypothetical protein